MKRCVCFYKFWCERENQKKKKESANNKKAGYMARMTLSCTLGHLLQLQSSIREIENINVFLMLQEASRPLPTWIH